LIAAAEFRRAYDASVARVLRFWTPEMQNELARHCSDWAPARFDVEEYLRTSWLRYYKALSTLPLDPRSSRICDIGGFWSVFPLTLKTLGFESVAMTESLRYYSTAFEPLFDHVRSAGVQVFDHDPFDPEQTLATRFDAIFVMAVLEHYPHSLKHFMASMARMLEDAGSLYIEVPNLAHLPRRIRFLFGISPLPSIATIYHSAVPFIGHHHEFTLRELRQLASLSGMRIVHEDAYTYSGRVQGSWKMAAMLPLTFVAELLSREARECLAVRLEKHATRGLTPAALPPA
jgi:2-polyprenyl-3-methyl-5-hydroxy-6-metoxy-1,4-benzoquinol methylase